MADESARVSLGEGGVGCAAVASDLAFERVAARVGGFGVICAPPVGRSSAPSRAGPAARSAMPLRVTVPRPAWPVSALRVVFVEALNGHLRHCLACARNATSSALSPRLVAHGRLGHHGQSQCFTLSLWKPRVGTLGIARPAHATSRARRYRRGSWRAGAAANLASLSASRCRCGGRAWAPSELLELRTRRHELGVAAEARGALSPLPTWPASVPHVVVVEVRAGTLGIARPEYAMPRTRRCRPGSWRAGASANLACLSASRCPC